ncbi:MAG TPA: carbohydrate porin [Methylocystis sp.]|nr:carbohydrate porin [Methylocystis sp.]
MRKIAAGASVALALQAGGAAAADVSAPPPLFSWAGFYIGADFGLGVPTSRSERLQAVSGLAGAPFDLTPPTRNQLSPAFGAHVGYNWQQNHLVYGLETEFGFLDTQRGPIGTFAAPPAYAQLGVAGYAINSDPSGSYFGQLRARLGWAQDRALFYLSGGVATGGWTGASTLNLLGGGPGSFFTSGVSDSDRMKFAVGAGVEYALGDRWSLRGEYLFLNQSYNTQVFGNGAGFAYLSQKYNETHLMRLGLNYFFEEPKSESSDHAAKDDKPKGDDTAPELYSMHGQITVTPQGYPKFRALYSGPNSLAPPDGQARATVTSTGFFGLRLWDGGEAYVNPDVDYGYGLSGTFGVAGFPSAEAYKVGADAPYERFHKYFMRQTIGLGGETEQIESGANQLAGPVDSNRLTLTIGKYSVIDIFDDNKYAHDGRSGFLNWTIVEMGAFDYAADAWGFTNGATAEWKQDWWTVRGGLFQLSLTPNGEVIEPVLFRQFSQVVELEARHTLLFGQQGKIKLLGYGDLGYIGKYEDALTAAFLTGSTPDVTQDRKKRYKAGGGVNIEQPITDDLGFFLRASLANGRYETIEFTEVERSLSGGFVLTGDRWGRPKDAIGLAGVVNGISGSHAAYLAAGGLGFIIGDGALNYGGEHILETYYKYNLMDGVHITGDFQLVGNPAYNKDRGAVSIFAVRLHADF